MITIDPQLKADYEVLQSIAKRNLIAFIFLILTSLIVLGGISTGFQALMSIFHTPRTEASGTNNGKVTILGGSGWIRAGEYYKPGSLFNTDIVEVKVSGEYLSTYYSISYLEKGAIIRLMQDQKVYTNDFSHKGITNLRYPPYYQESDVSDDDLTNVVLFKGNELEIKDISGRKINKNSYEIWLRVSYI